MPSKTPARPSKRVARRRPVEDPDVDEREESHEDEPEERSAPKMNGGSPSRKRLRRGFTEGQKQMDSTSSYAQAFKPEEKSQVIKFLEKDPYASFRRHWIEGRNDQGQRNVRAYTCPLSFDETCPLCEVGDKPQAVSAFNVAVIGDDGQVILRSWDVGARLFGVLKGYANDPKIGPLTKGFFMVSRTGKKNNTQYNVAPVRASTLEEDYDIPVPDDSEFTSLVVYTDEIVDITPTKKLRELAAELVADED